MQRRAVPRVMQRPTTERVVLVPEGRQARLRRAAWPERTRMGLAAAPQAAAEAARVAVGVPEAAAALCMTPEIPTAVAAMAESSSADSTVACSHP